MQYLNDSYAFRGASVILGAAMFRGEVLTGVHVKLPLKTINRHGLIAGATGTGKTKTLQLIAEGLSANGVPVLVMDVKGDFSGIAVPGSPSEKITERMNRIGLEWKARGFPAEFLSLSHEKGLRLRATVSEFGPVLFSRILELNDTQAALISVIFKFCDDRQLPLLDLKDIKKVLSFIQAEGKDDFEANYGRVSASSIGIILRKIVELEGQGADLFFGERSFDVTDLLRTDESGCGVISIIRLTDIQDRPKLFSTFMLCLLAEVFAKFPEEGDLEQPKLVIFIDEAHLIFSEASKALLEQIETIVRLIRSKGVGVFFCTQNPNDIPQNVLAQLGLKIQHALRTFTAKDRKDIKQISENFPLSDFYRIDELLTSLGIGEAAISVLNERGNPTPLAATLLCAPASRMNVLEPAEIDAVVRCSRLAPHYNELIDRQSAYELLAEKLGAMPAERPAQQQTARKEKSDWQEILSGPTARQVGRTVARELTRGLLGVLGLPANKSRKRKSSWF